MWDTVPHGIPCRVGYHAAWDTIRAFVSTESKRANAATVADGCVRVGPWSEYSTSTVALSGPADRRLPCAAQVPNDLIPPHIRTMLDRDQEEQRRQEQASLPPAGPAQADAGRLPAAH